MQSTSLLNYIIALEAFLLDKQQNNLERRVINLVFKMWQFINGSVVVSRLMNVLCHFNGKQRIAYKKEYMTQKQISQCVSKFS